MTDRVPKRRWSKRLVRTAAWTTAAAAFISALGAIGAAPTPATATRVSARPARQKIIVRRIIKKVVIVDPAGPAPVQVITTGGGTAPAPAGAPAPAPAPSPPTTGGS